MAANERQVAGTHYASNIQHWDFVVANQLNYFEGQITKYVARCRKKNGMEDLKKAQHFLDKYMEVYEKFVAPTPPPVIARLEGDDEGGMRVRRLVQDALVPTPRYAPGAAMDNGLPGP